MLSTPHKHTAYLLAVAFWVGLFLGLSSAYAIPIPLEKKNKNKLAVDVTLTSTFEYHSRNDPNLPTYRSAHANTYADLQNRLNLDIVFNQFRLGGRLDTYHFFLDDGVPCDKTFPECKGRFIPEKLYLKARFGKFDFVAGDYYLTIGRGIALSIRKVDEFGIDTSLRGGRASFRDKGFKATVAAGFTNINNMDPVTEAFLEDTNQFIFAGEISQKFAGTFVLGAHYVYADLTETQEGVPQAILERVHIAGGSLRFPFLFKRIDFYFEGDVFIKPSAPSDEAPGYAFYTSINLFLFPVTLQIEGQWYSNVGLNGSVGSRYQTIAATPLFHNFPPSMERQDLDTQGDNSNSKGFRVRLDYTLPSRTTIFHLNYVFRYDFQPPFVSALPDSKLIYIHNAFAGGEHRLGWFNLKYSAGIREITGLENWRLVHADIDANIQFLGQHSIELVSRYWWSLKREGEGIPDNIYSILDVQLGYAFARWVSVAILFAYSDEFDYNPAASQFFFAAELKIKLWNYGSIKFFGGSSRAGLRCVSGVCRVFPEFEGFRTELVFRL